VAKIPNLKRIITEDFKPEVQSWIGKLLQPLNTFMEAVSTALNKGLTIADNFDGQVTTITIDSLPAKFKWNSRRSPVGVFVVYAQEATGSHTTFTTAIFADWTYSDGQITILNLTGLSVSSTNKFNVTFVAIAG
jgi:hypothetical protein